MLCITFQTRLGKHVGVATRTQCGILGLCCRKRFANQHFFPDLALGKKRESGVRNNMPTFATHSKIEVVVYLVISPDTGPEYQVYAGEDIEAIGGVHALERDIEKRSYWFVRLGQIVGQLAPCGALFQESDLAELPEPAESAWRTGRLNPAFGRSEVEKYAFRTAFQVVELMLDSWKRYEEGTVEAYTLKELNISPQRLVSLTSGLCSLKRMYEVLEITVIKYWYVAEEKGRHLPCGLELAEFSLKIPAQFRWASDEKLLSVEVMPTALC